MLLAVKGFCCVCMWMLRSSGASFWRTFRSCSPAISRAMSYSVEERGNPYSFDYRIFFKNGDTCISPFHDIPLYPTSGNSNSNNICNMIVEVPRWSNAKMEISVSEPLNPIKQDIKKEKLRFVCNCFPHHGYIWNYGALPQTWEDPGHTDDDTGCKGDNDPLDVCEIGYRVAKRGEVRQVKILGTLALIDEGETDWKILAIDTEDPLAEKLNDIADIETHMPGFIASTVDWFRIYKVPAGKPFNQFAFDGKAQSREFATRIVQETHQQWQKMIKKQCDVGNIACVNTTIEGSPDNTTPDKARAIVDKAPPPGPANPIDPIVNKWHYVAH